jgi:hypothetical protein
MPISASIVDGILVLSGFKTTQVVVTFGVDKHVTITDNPERQQGHGPVAGSCCSRRRTRDCRKCSVPCFPVIRYSVTDSHEF